ncbi:hypothetical protein [Streptomyces melanosporofaciens]|uniref:Uncharacterized protein n=1 Tax=Streptomyces melanosporofaciens TaxID=67327 RepID=A0A1H4KBG4_STRMJ|nr:hypothetical protein [Streptomyces melanosporofaciens]SEB55606.1 hypothetical protein SAMN04490356_0542 [Streptomyces melanosporofaciens]
MREIRRIVTGHDGEGRSTVVEDRACPHVETTADATVTNLWLHEGRPGNGADYRDPVGPGVPLPPPARGSVLRVVEFPPREPGGSAFVHRTDSLDYAYVIDGEVYSVLDDGERTLEPYTETAATLIVDDLDECQARLNQTGAQIVRGPQTVPTGRNLTAKLPGGVQLEYVEWDEAHWERVGGRPA